MTLAEKIRYEREERGWTQVELAERLGMDRNTVWSLENTHIDPRLSTLRNLARVFGIPVEELFQSSGYNTEKP